MSKRKINIAFIDDGIDSLYVPSDITFKSLAVYDGVIREAGRIDGLTHGSACYTVFRNHVHETYTLISIKVLDYRYGNGQLKDMLTALEWCGANDIHLINMSIGTRQFSDTPALYDVVSRLSAHGIVMVAACSNRNTLTFPACFPMVIGVRHYCDKGLKESLVFLEQPYDNIDVMTCSSDIVLSHDNGQTLIFSAGNSLAAPFVTARVCDYMSKGCVSMEGIKQRLRKDSVKDSIHYNLSFYRQLLREWKDVDVPVVAVLNNNMYVVAAKMKELIKLFAHDEYNAIGLSPYVETNIPDGVYRLDTAETINDNLKWLFNFAQPDIIILHSSIDDLIQSGCNTLVDVLITELHEDKQKYKLFKGMEILDINMPGSSLYRRLIELLCSKDE